MVLVAFSKFHQLHDKEEDPVNSQSHNELGVFKSRIREFFSRVGIAHHNIYRYNQKQSPFIS